MARVSFELGVQSSSSDANPSHIDWQGTLGAVTALTTNPGGNAVNLTRFRLETNTTANTSSVQMTLSGTGEFSNAFEGFPDAIRVSCSALSNDLIFAGPNASGNTTSDDMEPYTWSPSDSNAMYGSLVGRAAINTWMTDFLSAYNSNNSLRATLILQDDPPEVVQELPAWSTVSESIYYVYWNGISIDVSTLAHRQYDDTLTINTLGFQAYVGSTFLVEITTSPARDLSRKWEEYNGAITFSVPTLDDFTIGGPAASGSTVLDALHPYKWSPSDSNTTEYKGRFGAVAIRRWLDDVFAAVNADSSRRVTVTLRDREPVLEQRIAGAITSGAPAVTAEISTTRESRIQGDAASGSPAVTARIRTTAALALTDFDSSGLDVTTLAVIEAGMLAETGNNNPIAIWGRAPRPVTGRLLHGELQLGAADTPLTRIVLLSSATMIRFHDNTSGTFALSGYFAASGDGNDETCYIQLDAAGTERYEIPCDSVVSSGDNWVTFNVPTAVQAPLNGIAVDQQVIVAFASTAAVAAQVQGNAASGSPAVAARIRTQATQRVQGAIDSGSPAVAGQIRTEEPARTGNRLVIELPAHTNITSFGFNIITWTNLSYDVSDFTVGSDTVNLTQFQVEISFGSVGRIKVLLSGTGEFTDAFEQYAEAFTLQCSALSNDLICAGPNASGNNTNDNEEPYVWEVGNSTATYGSNTGSNAIIQWMSDFRSAYSSDNSLRATLVLQDGGATDTSEARIQGNAASGSPTLTAQIRLTAPTPQRVRGDAASGSPTVSSRIRTATLRTSDFDDDGLTVETIAVISTGTATEWFGIAPRTVQGELIQGNLDLGNADTVITRIAIVRQGERITLNDNTDTFDIGAYFRSGGDGNDMTLYVQLDAAGTQLYEVPCNDIGTSGANYATFNMPAAVQTAFGNVTANQELIIALAQSTPVTTESRVRGGITSGSPAITAQIRTTAPTVEQRVQGAITSGSPAITAAIRATDGLAISDFNTGNLRVETIAVIEAGMQSVSNDFNEIAIWGRAPRPVVGSLVEGDLLLGPDNVPLNQIVIIDDGVRVRLHDNDSGFQLNTFFGAGGDGEDLRLFFQLDAAGTERYEIPYDLFSTGNNWVIYNVPTAVRTALDGIQTGDHVIVAFAALEAQVQGDAASGSPTLSARIRREKRLQGSITSGSPAVAAQIRTSSPSDAQVQGAITSGSPAVTAQIRTELSSLAIANFDTRNLTVETIAVLQCADLTDIFGRAPRTVNGSLIEGDLTLGPSDVPITRMRVLDNGSQEHALFIINNDMPDTLHLRNYFDPGGDGNDLTLFLQFDHAGSERYEIPLSDIFAGGHDWIQFNVPTGVRSALGDIVDGTEVIVAFASKAGALISGAITNGSPTVIAQIRTTAPVVTEARVQGAITSGSPVITATIRDTLEQQLRGNISSGSPAITARIRLTKIPARIRGAISNGSPTVIARIRLTVPGAEQVQGAITSGSPVVTARIRTFQRIYGELQAGTPSIRIRVSAFDSSSIQLLAETGFPTFRAFVTTETPRQAATRIIGTPHVRIARLHDPYGDTYSGHEIDGTIERVKVVEGKDTVRSLNPAKPRQLQARIALEASAFSNRPYDQDDIIELYSDDAIFFRGLLTKPQYIRAPGDITIANVRAYGMSQLLNAEISTPLYQDLTAADAIGHILDAAGWPMSYRSIDTTGLNAELDWWWVDRQTAWRALEDVLNTVGPPAQMYEQRNGVLRVLGTGWVSADTRSGYPIGSIGQPLPLENPQDFQDNRDVVNRAIVERTGYELSGLGPVWRSWEDIAVPANGEVRLTARFQFPVSNLQLPVAGTDYAVDTAGGGLTVTLENTHAYETDIVISTTLTRTVSSLVLQGQPLNVVGTADVTREDEDSIEEHEAHNWRGRPLPGLRRVFAEALAGSVVNAYADGITSRRFRLLVNAENQSVYDQLIALAPLYPVRLEVDSVVYPGRIRSITWDWTDVRLLANVIVDQDAGLLASGAGAFILGTSMLDSNAFLWV